jgi:hypothetical protein
VKASSAAAWVAVGLATLAAAAPAAAQGPVELSRADRREPRVEELRAENWQHEQRPLPVPASYAQLVRRQPQRCESETVAMIEAASGWACALRCAR